MQTLCLRTSIYHHTHSTCSIRLHDLAFRVCLWDLESLFICTLPWQQNLWIIIHICHISLINLFLNHTGITKYWYRLSPNTGIICSKAAFVLKVLSWYISWPSLPLCSIMLLTFSCNYFLLILIRTSCMCSLPAPDPWHVAPLQVLPAQRPHPAPHPQPRGDAGQRTRVHRNTLSWSLQGPTSRYGGGGGWVGEGEWHNKQVVKFSIDSVIRKDYDVYICTMMMV